MLDRVADDEIGPAALLEWGEPLGIAFYPDHATKADLIARMRALAAPREVHEVDRAEDALPLVGHDALILVEPRDETAAVTFFDRNRDHFTEARARVLLFLLRGGSGERALKDAPALASFARESSFEVSQRPRREDARREFHERYGVTPEEWLARWRDGTLADTIDNNHVLGQALPLTDAT